MAAILLQEDGWDVIGVTLRMHDPSIFGESANEVPKQARVVADQLGIKHYVIDCISDFQRLVLAPAWSDYTSCRTPSPCLRCNEGIKFGVLLNWALDNNCSALATGHYVKLDCSQNEVALRRGEDKNKDQAYFLAGLSQAQLSRIVFPLGDYNKSWVKEKARATGLPCADSKESQDTCYILPDLTFQETLQKQFSPDNQSMPGYILDWKGKQLAKHSGIHNFTIGQRRGVGVGAGVKAWVCRIDADTGNVHLTNNEDDLLSSEFNVSDLSWTTISPPDTPLECEVQVRHRSQPVKALLSDILGGRGQVILQQPVRAVTPGQAAVFYLGDRVLGRGWIEGVSEFCN